MKGSAQKYIVTALSGLRSNDDHSSSSGGSPSTPGSSFGRSVQGNKESVATLILQDSVSHSVGGGARVARVVYGKVGKTITAFANALSSAGGLNQTLVSLSPGIPADSIPNKQHPFPLAVDGMTFTTVKV